MHDHDDPETLTALHRTPKAEQATAAVSRSADPGRTDARSMLELQRLAGNASVSRLVAREPAAESEADKATEPTVGRSPVLDVVGRGGGEPLAPDLRTEMEGRLGADFGGVRLHRDSAASESAKAVDAHAYTVGNDVVFRSDRWDPSSSEGKHTLAHELSHVVQQANGPVDGTPAAGGIRVSSPGDDFEKAADRSADAALAGPAPAAMDAAGGPASAPSAQLEAAVPGEDELEDETAQGRWVQREAAPGEEEEIDEGDEVEPPPPMPKGAGPEGELEEEETAQGKWVQREAAPGEEELEEDETAQGRWVQREAAPEEEEEEPALG